MLYFLFLFASLADPVFEVREAATDRVIELVDRHPATFGPRLRQLAATATEPEVRARCRSPLAAYDRWRVVSYVPKSVPVWPCIDMQAVRLPLFGNVRCRATGGELFQQWAYRPCEGSPAEYPSNNAAPYWHNFRHATERMARDMIRSGATPETVDSLLLDMWKIENASNSDCGEKWKESSKWLKWEGGYPSPK